MSHQDSRDVQKIEVDVNVLLRDYVLLQKYAENLTSALTSVLNELNEVNLAKESIKQLSRYDKLDNILVSLDRAGYAYMHGLLKDTSKILVNIGAGYYVVVDSSKATEILERRTSELQEIRKRLEQELSAISQKLEELKQLIAKAQSQSSR